jgi:hypothetical protein
MIRVMNPRNVLLTSVAISILGTAASVVYFLLIYVPQRDRIQPQAAAQPPATDITKSDPGDPHQREMQRHPMAEAAANLRELTPPIQTAANHRELELKLDRLFALAVYEAMDEWREAHPNEEPACWYVTDIAGYLSEKEVIRLIANYVLPPPAKANYWNDGNYYTPDSRNCSQEGAGK